MDFTSAVLNYYDISILLFISSVRCMGMAIAVINNE